MPATPAPDEDAWWSGLRWVDAARMQLWRFEEAFKEEMLAVWDAQHRHQPSNEDSKSPRTWRDSLDARQRYDPDRPLRVPSWSLHMQVANELDLLGVAVRNVLRAQKRIPEVRRPTMGRSGRARTAAQQW